jgi:hypothetical protein
MCVKGATFPQRQKILLAGKVLLTSNRISLSLCAELPTKMILLSTRIFMLSPWIMAAVLTCIFPSCIPVDDFGRPLPHENPNRDRQGRRERARQGEMAENEQVEARRRAEMEAREEEVQRNHPESVRPPRDPNIETTKPGVDQFKPKPEVDQPKLKPNPDKPKVKIQEYPVAAEVPGRPGFVFSPFNNKVVDVKGIPAGTLVADPQYPPTEKKHFYVP